MSYKFGSNEPFIAITKEVISSVDDYENEKCNSEIEIKFTLIDGNREIANAFIEKVDELVKAVNKSIHK